MKNRETIISAPEIRNASGVFQKFQSLPGNENKTIEEFYYLMTTPCIERDAFLADLSFVTITSENVVNIQFEL